MSPQQMNQGKLSKKNSLAKSFEKKIYKPKTIKEFKKDTSVDQISQYLSGCKISLIGGGGIAAIELPKLARELRRHGADVHFCVTETCLKFIGIESLRWASQNEVIVTPTGLAEHICTSEAVIVTPATADIIAKASHGICSDGATTLLQSALGQNKTVIFCPTMHESLSHSPIIEENKDKLLKINGVYFIKPRQEEGKDKLPAVDLLTLNIAHIINKRKYYNDIPPNVLITLGGTRAMIDPVRCITNLSTGNLGKEVAKTFYCMGIQLTLLIANTSNSLPKFDYANCIVIPNYIEMYEYLKNISENKFNGIIHLLAGSDFIPTQTQNEKISSKQNSLNIELKKSNKIIDLKNLDKIPYKAAAKLTTGEKDDGLKIAHEMMISKKLNFILWSSSKSAWDKNTEHSGITLAFKEGEVYERDAHGKNNMANQFYLNFIENYKSQ